MLDRAAVLAGHLQRNNLADERHERNWVKAHLFEQPIRWSAPRIAYAVEPDAERQKARPVGGRVIKV
jgi:hypothetical protein